MIPLNEFVPDSVLDKVRELIGQKEEIRVYLAKRIPEIQEAAYSPVKALKKMLEGRRRLWERAFPVENEALTVAKHTLLIRSMLQYFDFKHQDTTVHPGGPSPLHIGHIPNALSFWPSIGMVLRKRVGY